MSLSNRAVTAVLSGCLLFAGALAQSAEEAPAKPKLNVPGLGDPGKLTSIEIEQTGGLTLRGPDSTGQLVVTGKHETGQLRDLTSVVTFEVAPANIISVHSGGMLVPLADGEATVTVKGPEGLSASAKVKVQNFADGLSINFPNQIVPIFTKLGCNAGGCHGKASGQNGFKLSLLGFYPNEDFEFLVKEGRGRRVFPAAPDRSVLLLKGINEMPHGGGRRIEKGSYEYRLIRRWIEQGMPYGKDTDPTVSKIEVFPKTRSMNRGAEQQLNVVAHYTDGSIEDVTRMAQFEPNDAEMAECSIGGKVKTLDLTGDVATMIRFAGQVTVFRASIPLGLKVDNLPPANNFVDEIVFNKLKVLGIPPSPVCDDGTFLRRVSLDVTGRLPTAEEAQAFIKDADPAKRDKLIDRLLASADYADYFANKWSAVLRNKKANTNQTRGAYLFHEWIRDSLHKNKPYHEFVRDVVAASGEISQNPPVVWYRSVTTAEQQLEDTAQLFLGLRIQCARCHHHPFEKWAQSDYYGFSAFFSRVGRKAGINGLQPQDEQRIFHNRGLAQAKNPRSGEDMKPTGLGAAPLAIPADDDPRHALVDWMSAPENPFFGPALANRYWRHFFGRGIVDPEDDMRVTNPASNPELLAALSQHFIKSNFDLKDLVRTICRSKTYQLSSEPNEYNVNDKQNFSRYYPKRLNAEVLYDGLNLVTNTTTGFQGMPTGTRAVQLPDTAINNYFLTVFGKPQGNSACECERSQEANLAQSLHLLNSNEVQGKLTAGNGRAATLAKEKDRSNEDKVRELYRWVYSREPIPDADAAKDELKIALAHIEKTENKQIAFEDLLWALINTKEFLFNH